MVQGAKRREEGTKWWSVFWEAEEGPLLDISYISFFEAKAKSEISEFDKGVGGRQKVGRLQQKGEVGIDEGDGIAHKGACVDKHWDFAETFGLWWRISEEVFATLINRLKA